MPVLSLQEINNNLPDNRYLLDLIQNPNLWNDIYKPHLH